MDANFRLVVILIMVGMAIMWRPHVLVSVILICNRGNTIRLNNMETMTCEWHNCTNVVGKQYKYQHSMDAMSKNYTVIALALWWQ